MLMDNFLYKVTLNWYREIHTFYTDSSGKSRALRNAISRLSKKLGVSYNYVNKQFINGKDNFKVERRD